MIIIDTRILETMLSDMEKADPLYRPSSYWEEIVKETSRIWFNEENIINFRSVPYRTGFRSQHPLNPGRAGAFRGLWLSIPILKKIFEKKNRLLENYFNNWMRLLYEYVHLKSNGLVESIPFSLVGNPDDIVLIGNKLYCYRFLNYFLTYCEAADVIDFTSIRSIIEIGGGYGGQAEIILKLHPQIRYILVDIPPTLYLAENYLKNIFPGGVMGYLETRTIKPIDVERLPEKVRVVVLAPWQITNIEGPLDLLWNAISFQEINRVTVAHYMSMISNSASQIFLHLSYKPYAESSDLPKPSEIDKILTDQSYELTKDKLDRVRTNYHYTFWLKNNLRSKEVTAIDAL